MGLVTRDTSNIVLDGVDSMTGGWCWTLRWKCSFTWAETQGRSLDCNLSENQKIKLSRYQLSGGTLFHYNSPLSVCAVSANNFLNTFRGLCEVKFAICQDPGVDSIMYLGDWVGREPYQYEHLWVHLYLTYYIGFQPKDIIFEIKLIVILVDHCMITAHMIGHKSKYWTLSCVILTF